LKLIFKYRREETKRGVVYRPVVKVSLKSVDGHWYTFTAYVDSGADVSILPKGDAELLGINIYEGELWRLTGIGRAIIPAYLHEVRVKIGTLEFPARVAFADLNEVPRLIGRLDIFRKFKVTFDEQNLQTILQTYD
jgi:hypothetical protein